MAKKFCTDSFWSSKLFNNQLYPIFTECFQYSLLLVPTLLFLVMSLFWLILRHFHHSFKIVKVSFDHWHVLKLSYQVLIFIFLVMEILIESSLLRKEDNDIDQMYLLSYFGLWISLILVFILTEYRRRTMRPICPILFLFWLTGTLTYSVRFYSNVCSLVKNVDQNTSLAILLISGSTIILFLLSFITECYSRFTTLGSVLKKKTPCPEEYAPILSKLTYFWLDKYIYRWYKDEMTDQTSFDLRKEDEATRNTDLVENIFFNKLKEGKKQFKAQKPLKPVNSKTRLITSECNNNDKESSESSPSPGFTLFLSLFKVYFPSVLIAWIFKIVHDILQFAMPFLLKILLDYISDKNNLAWQGYCLAVIFLLNGILSSILENLCFFITSNVGLRIRASIIGMIYRKTLRLSAEERNKCTSGEIVNIMSVDAERIMQSVVFSWFVISGPLQIIITLWFLYTEIGFSAFVGIALILTFFPLNYVVIKFIERFSDLELKCKDFRVKILTEILNGIKVLKMYAWEDSFNSKVTKIRNEEVKYIRNVSIGWGLIGVFWDIAPFFVMLSTFLIYIYSSSTNILTAEKAFVSLALFNLLKFPMIILPWGLTQSIYAYVSMGRIGKYLTGEEIDLTGIHFNEDRFGEKIEGETAIEISNGSFSWKKNDKIILKDINMNIEKGQLVALVGKVGTGKSSLLASILGEMVRLNGTISITGKIAYVPQEAWIQNKSLKDNIIFTQNYDAKFYKKVVEACCLLADLEQLPARDDTEIGERGINLSGGQKQRVSLARAVYQNKDVYLLDDPMSAVDAHVGQYLFDEVISNKGILGEKTRILVTHGLKWLPKVDEIIVLNSNGSISERGSFQELLSNGKDFKTLIQEYMEQSLQEIISSRDKPDGLSDTSNIITTERLSSLISEDHVDIEELTKIIEKTPLRSPSVKTMKQISVEENSQLKRTKSSSSFVWKNKLMESSNFDNYSVEHYLTTSASSNEININKSSKSGLIFEKPFDIDNNGQLIDDESTMKGKVGWQTYKSYFIARGSVIFTLSILTYVVFAAFQAFGGIWLERFTSDPMILNASEMISMNISYADSYSKILREKTNYYMKYYGLIGVGQIIMISLFWIGYTIGNVNASKKLHIVLLKAILRSPMSFFDTTPSGRTLNRFSKDMDTIDHTITMNISDFINCSLIVISSIIVIIIVTPWFILAIIPVIILYYFMQLFYMPSSRQSRRLDSIAASPIFNHFTETLQGCSVIRAFSEQSNFQKINQTLIDRSSKFKFIQFASTRWLSLRLDTLGNILVFGAVIFAIIDRHYLPASLVGLSVSYSLQITAFLNWMSRQYSDLETNAVAIERVREYSMNLSEAPWESKILLNEDWPNKGNVKFRKINFQYRDGLPLVLNEIDLDIIGGQKVGIVGRTGSGKSSLMQSMFRLAEPVGGTILIDDVDILSLGLHDLRKRLTILPQDPVIFCGTLRENLDPFETHTESELHESLERSHLHQWVLTLQEGLEYDCGEGGVNLSTGQKQLLCLARAILRKSKVLILDEATASVDVETDRLVMETVRQQFSESTVIIIAHRINTILDTDKVVVLDQGKVVEYGSPQELIKNVDGIFKSLVDQSYNNTS